jgi:hypothetical protein
MQPEIVPQRTLDAQDNSGSLSRREVTMIFIVISVAKFLRPRGELFSCCFDSDGVNCYLVASFEMVWIC